MGETENITAEAISNVMVNAIQAMKEAQAEIERLNSVIEKVTPAINAFPCVCMWNGVKCVRCEAVAALND